MASKSHQAWNIHSTVKRKVGLIAVHGEGWDYVDILSCLMLPADWANPNWPPWRLATSVLIVAKYDIPGTCIPHFRGHISNRRTSFPPIAFFLSDRIWRCPTRIPLPSYHLQELNQACSSSRLRPQIPHAPKKRPTRIAFQGTDCAKNFKLRSCRIS